MPFQNIQVRKCHGPRVTKGLTLNGYEVVVLENELLRIMVNVERGAMLTEFLYKPSDLDVLFKLPRGVRPHTSYSPASNDATPFATHHPEGWFECFPSGSLQVKQDGAVIGFHGEVWGLPFELVQVEEHDDHCAVTLTAIMVQTPWRLTKTLRLNRNEATLHVRETAENLGLEPRGIMWGQHPMFGAPFLDGNCTIEAPAKILQPVWDKQEQTTWPLGPGNRDFSKVAAPHSNLGKMIYLTGFETGKFRLNSPTWKLAFELNWNKADFPWMWICETSRSKGWGEYFLALEPFTGLPKALETGSGVITVEGRQSKTVEFQANIAPLG